MSGCILFTQNALMMRRITWVLPSQGFSQWGGTKTKYPQELEFFEKRPPATSFCLPPPPPDTQTLVQKL